jgi:hypothetical protein
MQIAAGIYLLSCTEAKMQVHPVLAAAILNFGSPASKYGLKSLSDGAIKIFDSENIEVVSNMYFVA